MFKKYLKYKKKYNELKKGLYGGAAASSSDGAATSSSDGTQPILNVLVLRNMLTTHHELDFNCDRLAFENPLDRFGLTAPNAPRDPMAVTTALRASHMALNVAQTSPHIPAVFAAVLGRPITNHNFLFENLTQRQQEEMRTLTKGCIGEYEQAFHLSLNEDHFRKMFRGAFGNLFTEKALENILYELFNDRPPIMLLVNELKFLSTTKENQMIFIVEKLDFIVDELVKRDPNLCTFSGMKKNKECSADMVGRVPLSTYCEGPGGPYGFRGEFTIGCGECTYASSPPEASFMYPLIDKISRSIYSKWFIIIKPHVSIEWEMMD